jgi:hypothetical protein
MMDRQEPAREAELPRSNRGRGSRREWCAIIVGPVFLGYSLPFFGIWLSLAVPFAVHFGRRQLWGAAALRSPLLAVLVWVGLWLPALSYSLTGWYWALTGRDLSTAWLLLPLCGPENIVVGTLVPAVAAAVVFAVGLALSTLARRPWIVIIGAWLAPWAHELTFTAVVPEMIC